MCTPARHCFALSHAGARQQDDHSEVDVDCGIALRPIVTTLRFCFIAEAESTENYRPALAAMSDREFL
jgi:hypothetical protein